MSANTSEPRQQTGAPADGAGAVEVATGDRREEVHFEPDRDPDQLVVASHLVKPVDPLPPHGHTPGAPAVVKDVPPVEDVLVAPETPSVWDARPTGEAR